MSEMTQMKKLPTNDLIRMADSGMSSYQIADYFDREHSIEVHPLTVRRALQRIGRPVTSKRQLREHPLIPWEVKASATRKNIFRMLTLADRMDEIPSPRRREVENFIRRLNDIQECIHYDDRHPNYFFTVPVRPGVDELIRVPKERLSPRQRERADEWDRKLGMTKFIERKIRTGEVW